MVVIVSTIRVCIGVCIGFVCGCKMKSTGSRWRLHNMSEEQWRHYFNEGGEV
jgi:hypothetical protein